MPRAIDSMDYFVLKGEMPPWNCHMAIRDWNHYRIIFFILLISLGETNPTEFDTGWISYFIISFDCILFFYFFVRSPKLTIYIYTPFSELAQHKRDSVLIHTWRCDSRRPVSALFAFLKMRVKLTFRSSLHNIFITRTTTKSSAVNTIQNWSFQVIEEQKTKKIGGEMQYR